MQSQKHHTEHLTFLIQFRMEQWILRVGDTYTHTERVKRKVHSKFEQGIKAAPGEIIHKNSSLRLSFTQI